MEQEKVACCAAGRSRPPQATQLTPGGPEEAQLRVLMLQQLLEPPACCEAHPQEACGPANGSARRGARIFDVGTLL